MATPSEKMLNALLGSVQRIEKIISQKTSDSKKAETSSVDPSIFSSGFGGMAKSLEKIESESRKTNDLLRELIEINSMRNKDILADISDGASKINKLVQSLPKFFSAIKNISKLPENSVDRLKNVLMLTAFIDPETGDPLVDQNQLDKAAKLMENIHSLAGGIIKYGLAMSAFLIISPLAIAGAAAFGLSLRLLDLAMGKHIDTERISESMGGLKDLGMAIALFGITMVGFSYVLPQIAKGALGFITVVAGLGVALWTLSKVLQWGSGGFRDTSPLKTLSHLGYSIAVFGVTMALMSYAAPQIFAGALVFTTVVATLGLTVFLLDKVLGNNKLFGGKDSAVKSSGPLSTLIKLGWSIAAFSASLVLVGLFVKPFALGAIAVTLAISAMGISLRLLGNASARRGTQNLQRLSISLGIFTLAMAGWVHLVQPKLTWEGLGMLGAAIGGMGLIATVLGLPAVDKSAKKGAANLILLGGALATFSIGLAIYAQLAAEKLSWDSLAMLGATIGTMALVGTILGIPAVFPLVLSGSIALIALGASLTAFSIGLGVYANTVAGKMTMTDLVILAGTVTAMGLIGSVVGIISPLVIAGSAALVVAGGALISISTGLSVFAKSNFTKENGENLNYALRSMMAGFLGYESLDDVGLSSLAKVPVQAGLVATMSASMLLASSALLPITKSLKIFKEANWQEGDSKILKEVIGSIIGAFTENLKDVDWVDLWFGLNSLNNVGNVLTGLAEGVGAFANLSFIEQEFDEKAGKLIPKRVVRLSSTDITNAGISIGNVINAMVEPVAKFGNEITSGIGSFIGIPLAINSLETLGSGLVNLATGVQDWSNMTVTSWGVQKDPKTGLNKLVPTGKTELKKPQLDSAKSNIGKVLLALTKPLSDFGKIFSSDSVLDFFGGLIDKTSVEKGIASMASLGTGLANMALGVSYWGNMKYAPMILGKNKETGLNELMPGKPIPLDIENAGKNIGSVLTALAKPLSDFGKIFSGGVISGLFGGVTGDDIITGIEQMGVISNNLAEMGKMVGSWNRFSFTEMEVKDGRLVPKKVHPLGSDAIEVARQNILKIIGILPEALGKYDSMVEGLGIDRKDIGGIISEMSTIQNTLGFLAKDIQDNWSGSEMVDSANNYKLWLYEVADPIIGQMADRYKHLGQSITLFDKHFSNFNKPVKSKEYHTFTDKLIQLSQHAKDFKLFADSFDRMADSMGKFSKNFSVMNADGLAAFSIWTDSLLQAIEVGKEGDAFGNFLDSADTAVNSAFKFGNKKLGFSDDNEVSQGDKKSVIDQTLAQNDSQQAREIRKLNSSIISLHNEISTLKAVMSGTLDVNIESVSSVAKFKIDE